LKKIRTLLEPMCAPPSNVFGDADSVLVIVRIGSFEEETTWATSRRMLRQLEPFRERSSGTAKIFEVLSRMKAGDGGGLAERVLLGKDRLFDERNYECIKQRS
jgi:hypothetical protein